MCTCLATVDTTYCIPVVFLCADEGVYVNSNGGQLKDSRLQWGEVPSSIGEQYEIVMFHSEDIGCEIVP